MDSSALQKPIQHPENMRGGGPEEGKREKEGGGGKGTNKIRRQIRIVITLLDGGNFRVEVGKQEKKGERGRERERNASLTKNKCKGLM